MSKITKNSIKKLLVFMLLMLMVSPAIAGRPKLRGPSSPNSQRIIRVSTRHGSHILHNRSRHIRHNRGYRSYRIRCNSRSPYRSNRQHHRIIVIVQPSPVRRINPAPKQRVAQRSRLKIVRVNPAVIKRHYQIKTLAKIIPKHEIKAKPYVYKIDERK